MHLTYWLCYYHCLGCPDEAQEESQDWHEGNPSKTPRDWGPDWSMASLPDPERTGYKEGQLTSMMYSSAAGGT